MRRTLGILVLALGCGLGGCRGRGSLELAEGCYTADKVPTEIRKSVEEAARDFYAHAGKNDWKWVYENASSAVRAQRSQEAFVTPMTRTFREIGFPTRLSTEAVTVVQFGPGFPFHTRLECEVPEGERPLTLLLIDYPRQASLVQRAPMGAEEFYFSTLWHGEESGWRLVGFFAKPATLLGKGWKAYDESAAAQRRAKNNRNAALLYNVAIDLVVPNAWTEPPEVEMLERKQSQISVSDLPVNQPDAWPSPPDTFRVHQVGYGLAPGGLCVMMRYQTPAALADTAAQAVYAERLRSYVTTTFPEYAQVFPFLALVAFDPAASGQTWTRVFPLGSTP